jgi:endoribonuclease LACTB2
MEILVGAEWIRRVEVRTPTLPPATHTNVYLLGHRKLCAVDPATPYPEERAALDAHVDALAAVGDEVVEILLTHHHVDHVSGAEHLARRLGVPILAHAETARKLSGRVAVDRVIADGERLPYGPAGLRAVLTPGHAPGHLCFIDEAQNVALAGDMVASVGTIIVEPEDDGDMATYIASLKQLRALRPRCLLPAHGPPIWDADGKLDFYVHHRLEREGRVLAALSSESRTVEELVPPSYPDVPPAIYPLAARSLLAHLLKLEKEGRARREGDRWRVC